jgi:hypothetical protein
MIIYYILNNKLINLILPTFLVFVYLHLNIKRLARCCPFGQGVNLVRQFQGQEWWNYISTPPYVFVAFA